MDQSSSVPEGQWYYADKDYDEWFAWCQSWTGVREYQCLDLFSASQRIALAAERLGRDAASFDIKSDARQDATTRRGFHLMLSLGMAFLGTSVYRLPLPRF